LVSVQVLCNNWTIIASFKLGIEPLVLTARWWRWRRISWLWISDSLFFQYGLIHCTLIAKKKVWSFIFHELRFSVSVSFPVSVLFFSALMFALSGYTHQFYYLSKILDDLHR
jgi:hypothetical protein